MLHPQQKITPKYKDLFAIFKKQQDSLLFKHIPKQHHYWVGSAREGLRQILIHNKSKKVAVPAYTCHVVPDAVKRAKSKIVYYDSGPIADIKDIQKIITKVDTLIVSYNFGLLPNIDEIVKLCTRYNVTLIEDCAQAFGAQYKGKPVGSFGDYAVYSFGISKNVGFTGGLITSKKPMQLRKIKRMPFSQIILASTKTKIAPIFFNKYLYPIFFNFLQKQLHKEQDTKSYRMHWMAKRIVLSQIKRYNKIQKLRKSNEQYCQKYLKAVKMLKSENGSSALYCVVEAKHQILTRNKLLENSVDVGFMETFQCFDKEMPKSTKAPKQVLAFALYRKRKDIEDMVTRIQRVCKNGDC